MSQQSDQRSIPKRVQRLHDHWLVLYRTWWATHYTIGILGGAAGGAAGVLASKPESSWAGVTLGLVAAVSTSLVTFLGPLQKAERYYQAYHVLDQAILEYEEGKQEEDYLIAEVKSARDLVLTGTVSGRHGSKTGGGKGS